MPITDPSASLQNYEMAALAATNIPRMNYNTLQQQQQASQMRSMSGYGNEYCGVENIYRPGMRAGIKAYSASGSPPPGAFYNEMLASQQQPQQQQQHAMAPSLRHQMVNNENIYQPQNWQQQQQQSHQQGCAPTRMMPSFNENSLFNDFLPNARANSFGSTNNYNSSNNYLCSLSSAHSNDEGLGDSPSST